MLSLQFEETVTPKDILSLPKYHAYTRLMIDGMPSKPFSVTTLPPPKLEDNASQSDVLRRLSRERYSEERSNVEEKIQRWAASASEGKKESGKQAKAKEKEDEERKKARKRGMKLDEYRKWRDRELWTNSFNQLRKKQFLGEDLSEDEKTEFTDLEKKLTDSGGVPPPSKALQEIKDREKGE